MKNSLVLLFPILLFSQFVKAQQTDIYIKSNEAGLYVEHKVMPKETFYSVSRVYNVNPQLISSFNKLDMNKGIYIDQKLKIPLTDSNFTRQGNNGTPLYYKVAENDNLTKISKTYKVSISQVRAWNGLAGDGIKKGQKLILGFMISPQLATTVITPTTAVIASEVKKEDKEAIKKQEKDEKAALEKERAELKAAEEEERRKLEEEKKKAIIPAVEKKEITPAVQLQEGFFKSSYELQLKKIPSSKNETVTSGIFKTASGWQDSKFYLLIDKVAPGTIVRIINPTNNRVVYAKVLGEMSGIRQNEGLNIRICNAAAAALDILETDKFIVKISY